MYNQQRIPPGVFKLDYLTIYGVVQKALGETEDPRSGFPRLLATHVTQVKDHDTLGSASEATLAAGATDARVACKSKICIRAAG